MNLNGEGNGGNIWLKVKIYDEPNIRKLSLKLELF